MWKNIEEILDMKIEFPGDNFNKQCSPKLAELFQASLFLSSKIQLSY